MVLHVCVQTQSFVKSSMRIFHCLPAPGWLVGVNAQAMTTATAFLSLWIVASSAPFAAAQDSLDAILKIEQGGKGIPAAHALVEKLAASGTSLETVLGKVKQANPVAKNWLLGLAQTLADKQDPAKTTALLEKILADPKADGEVRYWALDRLAAGNPALREKLLDGRTEDASLDIRFEAIQQVVKALPTVEAAKSDEAAKQKAIAGYQQLLKSARQHVQVNSIIDTLKELGQEVDMRKHFGFVSAWQVVGPFDNRKEVGFNTAYKPETDYVQTGSENLKATYPGKAEGAQAGWQPASTEKPDGTVDLNPIMLNEKGAVVYAYTVVESPVDVKCQVRYGTPNANKLWVNGTPAAMNNVYHTGAQIDQYTGNVALKKGPNNVLLKVCQNEQTEAWAQDFSFMLRFTDETGLAIPVTQAPTTAAQ